MGLIFSAIAFLAVAGACTFWVLSQQPVNRIVAHLATNDAAMNKVQRSVVDACNGYDAGDKPVPYIKADLAEKAKHAVAECFATIYRGQPFEVTHKKPFKIAEGWPNVEVMIRGDIAMIELNLGHSLTGLEPSAEGIVVKIKRKAVLTLDNRKPLLDAYNETIAPPPKEAKPAEPVPLKRARRLPGKP